MARSEMSNELVERGIGWQVVGFTIVGCAGAVLLWFWDGSGFWAYRIFEIAAKDLYWAFVPPLAWIFNKVRRMFEKRSEIRAEARREMLAKARRKWEREAQQERQRELPELRQELQRELRQELQRELQRERQQERQYRSRRMNEALSRFGVTNDQGVATLPITPEVVAFIFDEPEPEPEPGDA